MNISAYKILSLVLRAALVLALAGASWLIYQRLPVGDSREQGGSASETALLIVLRGDGPAADLPVELYPIDLAALRREYSADPHPGVRFEDFLKRHMSGRQKVEAKLDGQGRAMVKLTPGRWWIHALLPGTENVEWRLPINVAGPQQTVELTSDNAYARMRSF